MTPLLKRYMFCMFTLLFCCIIVYFNVHWKAVFFAYILWLPFWIWWLMDGERQSSPRCPYNRSIRYVYRAPNQDGIAEPMAERFLPFENILARPAQAMESYTEDGLMPDSVFQNLVFNYNDEVLLNSIDDFYTRRCKILQRRNAVEERDFSAQNEGCIMGEVDMTVQKILEEECTMGEVDMTMQKILEEECTMGEVDMTVQKILEEECTMEEVDTSKQKILEGGCTIENVDITMQKDPEKGCIEGKISEEKKSDEEESSIREPKLSLDEVPLEFLYKTD